MMKSKALWVAAISTIIAGTQPFVMVQVDRYLNRTFEIWPGFCIRLGYVLIFGVCVSLWIHLKNREKYVMLLFAVVNAFLTVYLFWYNTTTFGHVSGYNVLLMSILFFDFLFSCIESRKK